MNSYCEICGNSIEKSDLLFCCWKKVCREHSFAICPLCKSPAMKIPYLIDICQRCDIKEISIFCTDCLVSLCSQCNEEVHSKGKFKNHSIKTQDLGSENLCKTHSTAFDSFCTFCGLCCISCKCSHKKTKISEAHGLLVKDLKDLNEKIVGKLRKTNFAYNKFNKSHENRSDLLLRLKNDVNTEFGRLKTMLENKQEELLEIIDDRLNVYIQEYNSLAVGFIKDIEKLTMLSKLVKASGGNLYGLFSLPKDIIKETLEVPIETPSLSEVNWCLNLNLSLLDSEIESIILKEKNPQQEFSRQSSPGHIPNVFSIDSNPPSTPRESLLSAATKENSYKKLDQVHNQDLPPRPSYTGRTSLPPSKQFSQKVLKSRVQSPPDSPLVFKDVLAKRDFIKNLPGFQAIKLAWTHPNTKTENLEYTLECSLDAIDFKQVYKGKLRTCIITDLPDSTNFFFRVAPLQGNSRGEWSDLLPSQTFTLQDIDKKSLASHAIYENNILEFKSSGLVFAEFPYFFGKHYWEVKVFGNSQYSGFVKIGVTSGDKKSVIGRSILYGKSEIVVRTFLDIESGFLIFYDANQKEEDVIKVSNDGPLYPAVHCKTSKHSQQNLKLSLTFTPGNF